MFSKPTTSLFSILYILMQIHPHAKSEMTSDFTFYCLAYDGVELEAGRVVTGLNLNRILDSFSTLGKTSIDNISEFFSGTYSNDR